MSTFSNHLANKYAIPLSQNVLLRHEVDRLKFFHDKVLDPRLRMLFEVMIGRARGIDGWDTLSKRSLKSAKEAANDLMRMLNAMEEHISPIIPKITEE